MLTLLVFAMMAGIQESEGMSNKATLLASGWLDLRRNEAAHARDVAQSTQIGYQRLGELSSDELPAITSFEVDRAATGMGSACPFSAHDPLGTSPLPLLFQTDAPLIAHEECQAIIDEARAHIYRGGGGSGFTLADTNRNLAVADLPKTLRWLNLKGLPRVAAMAGACFDEGAIGPAKDLLIYRALVVQYDAAAGLTHQEIHRDGSLVTVVVALNDRSEYSGGGTFIEALGRPFALPRGHGLLQASALRHAGHAISSGERWVLVLFLISERMKFGEHLRHFKTRAHRLVEEGDAAGELRCLSLARALCDDMDPDLLFDEAVGLEERGEKPAAAELYRRAHALNPADTRPLRRLEVLCESFS